MAVIRATAESTIEAPAALVYRCIVDFRNHHGKFLPPAFSDFRVESGGLGAGTVIRFRMSVFGGAREVRARVAEPEPGRVVTETDLDTGIVTTFTVTPDGERCRVRIETVWEPEPNWLGRFERLLGPFLLRRLYADELRRLDVYAKQLSGR